MSIGEPRLNNACHQGAHDACDQMTGGTIRTGEYDYELHTFVLVPCECPHHAEPKKGPA